MSNSPRTARRLTGYRRQTPAASPAKPNDPSRSQRCPGRFKINVPVLALDGSLDLAVPAALDLPAIRDALRLDRDATILELPGLNHLFQNAKTGAPSEFARIPETMAPSALALITNWVRKRSTLPPRPASPKNRFDTSI